MVVTSTVLIVDDEASLRQSLSLVLKSGGYRVTTASSVAEANQFLKAGAFDLVFLDLKMPEVDGLTLLREIRRLYPHMPVLILTAHATLDSAMEAVRLGARDYLLKPIDPERILARAKEILAENQEPTRLRQVVSQIQDLIDELNVNDPATNGARIQAVPAVEDPNRYFRRGTVALDMFTRRVHIGDRDVLLPPSTFDFLATLIRHAPNPVSYELLVQESQGYSLTRAEAREMARWQIHEIRKAIEEEVSHPRYIITVRDVGYRLVP
jgi:DNA-binding response OmpR family regulator